MTRGRKARETKPDAEAGEGSGIDGEYIRPDAARAFEIYDKQIKPKLAKMDTLKGDLSQPYDDIKEQANFPRKVLNFIVSIEGEEDAKRDHLLLALSEGLKHRKLYIPRDLVSIANGEDGDDVIPSAPRDDDGLAGLDDEDDEFEEASEEELAAQEGRSTAKPAAGTGAAAIAAMKAKPAPASSAAH